MEKRWEFCFAFVEIASKPISITVKVSIALVYLIMVRKKEEPSRNFQGEIFCGWRWFTRELRTNDVLVAMRFVSRDKASLACCTLNYNAEFLSSSRSMGRSSSLGV